MEKEGEWIPGISRNVNNKDILDLLDDKTTNKIVQNFKKALPPGGLPASKPITIQNQQNYTGKRSSNPPHPQAKPKASDTDLLSQMAQKLSKVEKLSELQRKEIKEKSTIISGLQNEIETLKITSSPEYVDAYTKLQQENDRLRSQISEMEHFLSDYGLKWVGGQKEGNFDINSLKQDIGSNEPVYRYNLPREIDVIVLERRIQELNMIAEKDAARWVAEGAVHRFKAPESISIAFYKNGLILQGFQFKPYSSNEAQSILSDILDGYFPYDLKRKYPDGIPLRLVDKTEEMYKAGSSNIFGANDPGNGLLSKDQFLDQLPENVIRNGNIVPIREDISKMFDKGKAGTIEVKTHIDNYLQTPEGANNKEAAKTITTLRIKTETGMRNLIIKLWFSDTLQTLKRYIDENREGKGRYELRSTFPARVFDLSDGKTLQELELIPNFALAMRLIS
ncbi:prom [Blepharisma stoltei]|uniref:UBX domain-containing protein 11 n=1 Tax=Blepharisma stoltei TaxID=1481888 RepID=A0AAU9IYC3_9CILI|nr:unnamed protein product [Blepharisma stoltei]